MMNSVFEFFEGIHEIIQNLRIQNDKLKIRNSKYTIAIILESAILCV